MFFFFKYYSVRRIFILFDIYLFILFYSIFVFYLAYLVFRTHWCLGSKITSFLLYLLILKSINNCTLYRIPIISLRPGLGFCIEAYLLELVIPNTKELSPAFYLK